MLSSELLAERNRLQQHIDSLESSLWDVQRETQSRMETTLQRLLQRLSEVEYSLAIETPPID